MLATFRTSTGREQEITVLVDTGAEVNLIRRGLLPEGELQPVVKPLKFTTASSDRLEGGKRKAEGTLRLQGIDPDTKRQQGLICPVTFYEAATSVDAIFSYGWMAECNFMVNPQRHGLVYHDEVGMVWMEGLGKTGIPIMQCTKTSREEEKEVKVEGEGDLQATCAEGGLSVPKKPMTEILGKSCPRMLDLFCGTGSIRKVFRGNGL